MLEKDLKIAPAMRKIVPARVGVPASKASESNRSEEDGGASTDASVEVQRQALQSVAGGTRIMYTRARRAGSQLDIEKVLPLQPHLSTLSSTPSQHTWACMQPKVGVAPSMFLHF